MVRSATPDPSSWPPTTFWSSQQQQPRIRPAVHSFKDQTSCVYCSRLRAARWAWLGIVEEHPYQNPSHTPLASLLPQIHGTAEQLKGSVEATVGKLAHNPRLAAQGAQDKAEGRAEKAAATAAKGMHGGVLGGHTHTTGTTGTHASPAQVLHQAEAKVANAVHGGHHTTHTGTTGINPTY